MALSISPRDDQLFPTLTPAQIDRVAAHGRRRHVEAGQVLVEAGQAEHSFFAVVEGEVEVIRTSCDGEEVVTTHHQGQFSGEINLLAGRRPLTTLRVTQPGEVVELRRDAVLALVQDDAE